MRLGLVLYCETTEEPILLNPLSNPPCHRNLLTDGRLRGRSCAAIHTADPTLHATSSSGKGGNRIASMRDSLLCRGLQYSLRGFTRGDSDTTSMTLTDLALNTMCRIHHMPK